ncbi:MAG TPA: AAA family ATPase, partial [Burkholderiales bacterium]|nr:AAA family ATPase [Burkholderiales bacterium]
KARSMFGRWVVPLWKKKFAVPYVHLVFGARQTGKSTLLRKLMPEAAVWLDFSRPAERAEYLRNPDLLVQRCRALPRSRRPARVVVDEAQNVPTIFHAVQHLYDSDQRRWRFVLCGSSARKLRITGANLLPGRSLVHHLYPLLLVERPPTGAGKTRAEAPLPMPTRAAADERWFPATDLLERLTFGELPGVAIAARAQRADLLRAYTVVYLEEELRREALVKNWPAFARFLQLAAAESGQMINYAAISREAGVSLPTVKTYYQLLEDMFTGFRVTAFSGSPRKSLLSTERFFFFDVGVRNAGAELPLETAAVRANPGPVFEQWVGIELWKRLQYLGGGKLHYLRTKAGAEVDFIVARGGRLIPIEVKWTEHPTPGDARHLLTFLDEHPKRARHGYVICRCAVPLALTDRVTALPWSFL